MHVDVDLLTYIKVKLQDCQVFLTSVKQLLGYLCSFICISHERNFKDVKKLKFNCCAFHSLNKMGFNMASHLCTWLACKEEN